jgi:hypothetical protein
VGARLEDLPEHIRVACVRLRDALEGLLGIQLVALWAFGAAICPDRPKGRGDVDIYAVLSSKPEPGTTAKLEAVQAAIGRELGIEWDSWYILEAEARTAELPRHALGDAIDGSWSLHRAHWLAGDYIALSGYEPQDLVVSPTWSELLEGLKHELAFIDEAMAAHTGVAYYSAYCVANACRILYSVEHTNVVVSKRAASLWALAHMPAVLHSAIRAAIRVYDDEATRDDIDALSSCGDLVVEAAHQRLV